MARASPRPASFLERLGERHLVLAPEQPGYGTSSGFEQVEDLLDLVLFYRELVKSFGSGAVDLVGHSTGGMIAAELAIIAPEQVRGLVLVDAFGLWLDDEPSQDPLGAAQDVLAAKWFDPEAKPDPEPTNFAPDPDGPYAAIVFQAHNLATATKFMWPMAERGLRRRLPYLDVPTLVINGAADGLVPPELRPGDGRPHRRRSPGAHRGRRPLPDVRAGGCLRRRRRLPSSLTESSRL